MFQFLVPLLTLTSLITEKAEPVNFTGDGRALNGGQDESCVFPLMLNVWSMGKEMCREFEVEECRKKSFCELSNIESLLLGRTNILNSTTFSWIVDIVEILPRGWEVRKEMENIMDGVISGKKARNLNHCSIFYPDCEYPFRQAHIKMFKWFVECDPFVNFKRIFGKLFNL